MSDILLATKIRVPPVHGNLVYRPHLIRRLNDGIAQGCRLTLISAPAGYGKSTLLSEWVSQVGIPAAWLSLEKGEDNPARFWNYFVTALSTLPCLRQAGIDESILEALQSPKPPPMDELLGNLANEFSRLEASAILVLDDLHAVTKDQIHRGLVFLIDHLPISANGLHLVVASRMDPPWPLARWRVRDELIELRSADLRFSYNEVFQFLKQTLSLKLSSQDITALQARTEGWIAGLQMAAVSMQGRLKAEGSEGVSRFIETFTGSNRFILDYLMEEVITQQPTEMRDFLHETSILEQFTAPLCDALLGRHDSQAILDQVEQANLFLNPLDDERQWYRYHQLFAELLRKRLKQMRPDQITELHRRASHWYAEHNFLSEAISHALDAGDVLYVNELVSGNALDMVEHAELFDVLRHFEEIPIHQISSKPWLSVAYAWAKAYADPSTDMERLFQQAEQSLAGVNDALERQRLDSYLTATRAYVAWVKGEPDKALEFICHALENFPEDDWMARSRALNIKGLALQYKFDLTGATRSFEAAVVAGEKTGRTHETFNAYSNLAYVNLLQGRLRQAISLCQHVLSSAAKSGQVSIRMPVLAYTYATMSIVQLEWNDVGSAISSARQGVALADQWNQADTLHYTLTCLSNALRAAGDLEEAFAVNHRAMQLAANISPWFFRISACAEIGLNLDRGDIPAAAARFAEIEPLVERKDKKGIFLITKASLLNAQGRFSEAVLALEEPVSTLERRADAGYLMHLMTIQALALQALGQIEDALAVINRCLALAEPEGYVRVFVEWGAPMVKLLKIALSRGIATDYINKLLPAFNPPVMTREFEAPGLPEARSKFQNADLIEPLSEREIEVLRLLDSALTSEEIGSELYVSVNTIRTHIRNIYSKLDVHGRIEAIQKAKQFGLI